MQIVIDDLTGQAVQTLLRQHLTDMHTIPHQPQSVHALDLAALRQPGDYLLGPFWQQQQLAGCAALKQLDASQCRNQIDAHGTVLFAARVWQPCCYNICCRLPATRGYQQLYLETGSMAFFGQPGHYTSALVLSSARLLLIICLMPTVCLWCTICLTAGLAANRL